MNWNNLDLKCAIAAEAIFDQLRAAIISVGKSPGVKKQDIEKLCTDSGAVLSEHGLYACFLYLWSKVESKTHDPYAAVLRSSHALLKQVFALPDFPKNATEKNAMLSDIRKISENLDSLFLAKRLVGHVLTYARYHAKGLPKPGQTAQGATVAGTTS